MDLMELGAIGELVGGVAVLITLIYLALQVRHGNEIAQDNASTVFAQAVSGLNSAVASDRGFAEIWVRGGNHFAELDDVDRQRLVLFEWKALDIWHLSFQQRQAGIMTDTQWDQAIFNLELMGQRQSVREAWEVFRAGYKEEFRTLMDAHLRS